MPNGKVAVITGASSGIGKALALELGSNGVRVVIGARRESLLRDIAEKISALGGEALPLRADVSRRVEAEGLVRAAIERFGRLDILVNNAGRGHFAAVEETTDEMMRSMFELNVYPLWYTVRPALAQMQKQGSGHIINIASMAGKIGYPFNSAYVAAKHAVVGFTHALRMELVETGIHATVVCPAGVLTDWASLTEGMPMLPFFSASGPIIRRLAAERGIALPAIAGVKRAEEIALRIRECIDRPVPELYTHEGSAAFVQLMADDRDAAEKHLLPVVLGERAAYRQMKSPPP